MLNNAVLEEAAKLERALGGEFIFDRVFLEASVSSIASKVHHVVYSLNALTENRFVSLYDSYQDIRSMLDEILSGHLGVLTESPVLISTEIGWELEPLVGIDLVCLSELRHHPGIQSAQGVVITREGTSALCDAMAADCGDRSARFSAAAVREALAEQIPTLLGKDPEPALTVTATRLDDDQAVCREVSRTVLILDRNRGIIYVASTDGGELSESVPLGGSTSHAQDGLCQRGDVSLVSAAFVEAMARIAKAAATQLRQQERAGTIPFCLLIQSASGIQLSGRIRTRAAGKKPLDALAISAWVPGKDAPIDTYFVRRSHPYDLLESVIHPHQEGWRFADRRLATDDSAEGGRLARGSAMLDSTLLKSLAETALLLERFFGAPVQLDWNLSQENGCRITHLRPLTLVAADNAGSLLDGRESAPVLLCSQGQMVQSGIAAGTVVHVHEDQPAEQFPLGAVAVARTASPALTPVLQRAAAMITEIGSAAGHLATVARELRIPAIFGVSDACRILPSAAQVTVDAGETKIYGGIVEHLLLQGAGEADLTPQDREYRMLRRLLRFITPLNLIDSKAENFAPNGCRTLHDIIHFCHEMAVDELAHFQERRRNLGAIRTRQICLAVPLDLRILDIGGGIMPGCDGDLAPENIASKPFASFLRGVDDPRARDLPLPALDMRDILAGMPRTLNLLAAPADGLGANLAIIGRDYINVSLRLGYHFSVIDALVGADDARNYVYFRFSGGLASEQRRGRRAHFISGVLSAMDFKVTVDGDLVTGRLKWADVSVLQAALGVLGALTVFARQRDTALASDAETVAFGRSFVAAFLSDFPGPKPMPPAGSGP